MSFKKNSKFIRKIYNIKCDISIVVLPIDKRGANKRK